MALELEDLTGKIIGAAIEVHRKHGLLLNFAKVKLKAKRVIAE